jgi:acyl-CoA thioesterase
MPEGTLDEGGVLPRFDRHLGITTHVEAAGTCTAELRLKPEHRNIEGRIHGGVFLALLDTAMGHAIASLEESEGVAGAATMQLSCQFMRPPAGDVLHARGAVVRVGQTSAFVEGILLDDRGAEVARAHGVWRLWRREGGGG